MKDLLISAYRQKRSVSYCIAVFMIFIVQSAESESALIFQRVALPVNIAGDAQEVLCLGKSAGALIVSRAMLNPISTAHAARSGLVPQAMVGCAFTSALDADGAISVIINRAGHAPSIFAVRAESVLEYESQLDSEQKASRQLQKQREVLASYQVQVNTQERALVRLRNDADLIGAQHGFAEIESRFKASSSELTAIDREINNIGVSIEQIKAQPAAVNGAAREIEITKQLAELAQAARMAEQTQQQQVVSADSALTESMRLIEETRFDQPDQIRSELVKVRRRRQELEETLQEQAQSALDYE